MKNKWRSYIYVPVLACFLAIGGLYILNRPNSETLPSKTQIYNLDEIFESDMVKPTEVQTVDDKSVLREQDLQTTNGKEAAFELRMVDNYVVVYRKGNMHESYMTTGIEMKELPVETQNEIISGKEIKDEEALYFFLESHSS